MSESRQIEEERLTALWGQLIKVYKETDIVICLWGRLKEVTVLASENILHAIADKLVPTANAHRKEESSLAIWGREMETDTIEIDELDVKGCRPKGGENGARVRGRKGTDFMHFSASVVCMI